MDAAVNRRLARREFLAGIVGIAGLAVAADGARANQIQATPASPETMDALAAAGLVGSTSYRSPIFGYTVEWDDAWQPREAIPGLPPVKSNPNWAPVGRDDLFLEATLGSTGAELSFITFAYEGITRQQRFDEVLSTVSERSTVLWNDPATTAMVYARQPEDAADPVPVMVSMLLDQPREAVLHLDLQARQQSFADALAAVGGVLLDGAPVFASLPVAEILPLVDAFGTP